MSDQNMNAVLGSDLALVAEHPVMRAVLGLALAGPIPEIAVNTSTGAGLGGGQATAEDLIRTGNIDVGHTVNGILAGGSGGAVTGIFAPFVGPLKAFMAPEFNGEFVNFVGNGLPTAFGSGTAQLTMDSLEARDGRLQWKASTEMWNVAGAASVGFAVGGYFPDGGLTTVGTPANPIPFWRSQFLINTLPTMPSAFNMLPK
jgi:hypothetical protein